MRAFVRLRVHAPDLLLEPVLGPGDLIGRAWSAALQIDHPQISEAHAWVSLRGGTLKLLALRGRFLVDGQPTTDVELAVGQRLHLAPQVSLEVLEVALPEHVLGLEGEGLPRQVLVGACSLLPGPPPRLAPGAVAGAAAQLWTDGAGWRCRVAGEAARALVPGDLLEIGPLRVQAVAVAVAAAAARGTRFGVDGPLEILARYDTLHLRRDGAAPVALSGQMARLISELASTGAPLSWESAGALLWPDEDDRDALRRRWDVLLARLRQRLRQEGVRPDLVRSTGNGLVELLLHPGDRVVDET
jgi:hypothetical protein